MTNFKDNFSKQSDIYLKYRPHYPPELYAYLSSLTEQHETVWDCGTGNGQAATGMAEFYEKVMATDPSEQQIANAIPHKKVKYKVEKAEESSMASDSVDLITIASALHWFDFEVFYKEVKRVIRAKGIIAAWAYGLPVISPALDSIIKKFHDVRLGDYWKFENRLIEKEYNTIPFPFEQVIAPEFYYEKSMNLQDLIGYLNTWSATQRFIAQNKFNPTEQLQKELLKAWKEPNKEKMLRWKVILKVGRVVKG